MKFTSSLKAKLIYIIRINDDAHAGCLKVGEATIDEEEIWGCAPNSKALNEAARKRVNAYTQTAGVKYELLHTEVALYVQNGTYKSFSDSEVHGVLVRSGIEKKVFDTDRNANEWFHTDLATAKKAIGAVKSGRDSLHSSEITVSRSPVIFRPEQQSAIDKTLNRFKKGNQMLWFAKMRFGKTLSALQVVKEMDAKCTLILTHRPVVDAGWFEDFSKIFYDKPYFRYGSREKGDNFQTLKEKAGKDDIHYIYFASIQDLRGSERVGGTFNKNDEVFNTDWNLIIIDEAHEGTQTELGQNVIKALTKKHTRFLHLSGTPFNLLDNYEEKEIFIWDYVMEQQAKSRWDETHFGDPNPYAGLPKLNIFTYDLGKLLSSYVDTDIAFNFREFFRVSQDGNFVHRNDVFSFLNLISKKDEHSNYPYSTEEYRNNFRHSLWMIPGVKEARALSALLKQHPVFGNFEIVNVAGDGDEEVANEESLKKVQKAITDTPHETYTITLSCGRLTTGVSVPAWTAVFMLAGSHNTSAAAYMQTIFRVQTPAVINGREKVECFVFDFAPDRTLKMVVEAAKISAKAGKTSERDREAMGAFLNFCPIIAVEGSTMKAYRVEGMLEQLKKAYVERVVRNGFEDGYLYNNDLLMKLEDVEVEEFNRLKKVIGSTKAMPKSSDIELNSQGFTDEQYGPAEQNKGKGSTQDKDKEEDERARHEERKKRNKMRQTAISILRGISIRMPLLIYGANVGDEDKQITIENFTELIDDQSWAEFMPAGVTKERFEDFKKYYEPDVFRAAGKRIRAMAKAADNLAIEERIDRITSIFATFRNPDKETVLTPWRVVNMHLGDCLGGYVFLSENRKDTVPQPTFINHGEVTDSVFCADAKILEINSKSGLYPLYMAYSIYRNILEEKRKAGLEVAEIESQQQIWDRVVRENIFVICKTPMAKSITHRTLVGFRDAKVNTKYFKDLVGQITHKQQNFINKVKHGETYWKTNKDNNMKFDAVVGNPPYQDTAENTSDNPIYHLFMDVAFRLSDKVTFITPARFLFNAGKTPKEWNEKRLNDKHFKVIWYKSRSQDIFPNVDIKGGVAVTFRDLGQEFGEINIFSPHPEVRAILVKVSQVSSEWLSDMVYSPESYRLTPKIHIDYPELASNLSNGHLYDLTTNIFDKLGGILEDNEPTDKQDFIRIWGRQSDSRTVKWLRREFIDNHPNLFSYKVLLPKSNGSGIFGETLSSPLVGEPGMAHTQTFISIGALDLQIEAIALLKYIKTKFSRLLLGTLKVTQDNKKDVWKNIPIQDFTENSDIDWSQPVADIDRQLYKKYNLSEEEIDFIERMVKPME